MSGDTIIGKVTIEFPKGGDPAGAAAGFVEVLERGGHLAPGAAAELRAHMVRDGLLQAAAATPPIYKAMIAARQETPANVIGGGTHTDAEPQHTAAAIQDPNKGKITLT